MKYLITAATFVSSVLLILANLAAVAIILCVTMLYIDGKIKCTDVIKNGSTYCIMKVK